MIMSGVTWMCGSSKVGQHTVDIYQSFMQTDEAGGGGIRGHNTLLSSLDM